MRKSDSIKNIAAAMAAVQALDLVVQKDKVNTFFKSKYADLADVWAAIRGPLTENGLSVVQGHSVGEDGIILLNTTLMHSSGEWFEWDVPLVLAKADPQGVAAATTYMRRAALSAAVGLVADDDDDGNSVSKQPLSPPPAPAAPRAPAPHNPVAVPMSKPVPPKPPVAATSALVSSGVDPFAYEYSYLDPGMINAMREQFDLSKTATEKASGYASGVLKKIVNAETMTLRFDGEDFVYSGTDIIMLMLMGRTFDALPNDVAQWVFRHLVDTRSVTGPDGRFVAGQREPNPDYSPGLVSDIAKEFAEYVAYLTA